MRVAQIVGAADPHGLAPPRRDKAVQRLGDPTKDERASLGQRRAQWREQTVAHVLGRRPCRHLDDMIHSAPLPCRPGSG